MPGRDDGLREAPAAEAAGAVPLEPLSLGVDEERLAALLLDHFPEHPLLGPDDGRGVEVVVAVRRDDVDPSDLETRDVGELDRLAVELPARDADDPPGGALPLPRLADGEGVLGPDHLLPLAPDGPGRDDRPDEDRLSAGEDLVEGHLARERGRGRRGEKSEDEKSSSKVKTRGVAS